VRALDGRAEAARGGTAAVLFFDVLLLLLTITRAECGGRRAGSTKGTMDCCATCCCCRSAERLARVACTGLLALPGLLMCSGGLGADCSTAGRLPVKRSIVSDDSSSQRAATLMLGARSNGRAQSASFGIAVTTKRDQHLANALAESTRRRAGGVTLSCIAAARAHLASPPPPSTAAGRQQHNIGPALLASLKTFLVSSRARRSHRFALARAIISLLPPLFARPQLLGRLTSARARRPTRRAAGRSRRRAQRQTCRPSAAARAGSARARGRR